MALLCRIKEVIKPNNIIFNNFKRFYFQIHTPRLPILDYNNHYFQSSIAPICRRRDGFLNSSVRFFAAPVQVVKKKVEVKKLSRPRLNDEINAEFVRLVTAEGHSVVSRREALQRAKELKFDLVEVDQNAKPPVCRVMNYHREMYNKKAKGKEKAKIKSAGSLRKSATKEVRFSAKAELKDIQIKADTVKRLMDRGYRVKCTALAVEGRDLSGLLSQISALIEDVSFVEFGPKVDEKQGYLIVRHIKFGPSKKGKKGSKGVTPTSTNSEIQKESSTPSDGLVDSEEQIHSGESDIDSDDEESDFDLNDEVKPPLQGQGGRSSSRSNNVAPNFVPNVAPNSVPNVIPTLQPENRYAKKGPNNAPPARYPNSGTQPQPHSHGFPPVGPRQAGSEGSSSRTSWPRQNENLQPRGEIPNQAGQSRGFPPVGPRQAGSEGSSSRTSWPRQNENLQPHGEIPNRAGQSRGFPPVGPRQAGSEGSFSRTSWPRQNENLQPRGEIPNRAGQSGNNFSPHVGSPRPPSFNSNDGSKSKSFGLFSGDKAEDGNFKSRVDVNQQGTGKSNVRGHINPPTSKSDGCAASNDKKWGIFSGENSVAGKRG